MSLAKTLRRQTQNKINRSSRNKSKRSARGQAQESQGALAVTANHAALSKATIQKTVRFNPHLIIHWEKLNEQKLMLGETPMSFQQVQNDALKLWLQKNE